MGADPNKKVPLPFSPLILAVKAGKAEMVTILLEHGAKVDFKGYKGLTALMWASLLGRSDLVGLLIDHGAAIDARSDHKSTPLMFASQMGREDAVRVLLDHGANPRLRDADRDSALELAQRKKFASVAILIEKSLHNDARIPATQFKVDRAH
jgi:ankyrin repeat protein